MNNTTSTRSRELNIALWAPLVALVAIGVIGALVYAMTSLSTFVLVTLGCSLGIAVAIFFAVALWVKIDRRQVESVLPLAAAAVGGALLAAAVPMTLTVATGGETPSSEPFLSTGLICGLFAVSVCSYCYHELPGSQAWARRIAILGTWSLSIAILLLAGALATV